MSNETPPRVQLPVLDEMRSSLRSDGSRAVVHPADVSGRWATLRRWTGLVLILIWIILPLLRVGGRPAVFIDVLHRRFHLFGGTFNPPHAGHMLVAEIALRRLKLDRLWLLVTPGNPLKDSNGLPPLAARMDAARELVRDPRIVSGFTRRFLHDLLPLAALLPSLRMPPTPSQARYTCARATGLCHRSSHRCHPQLPLRSSSQHSIPLNP